MLVHSLHLPWLLLSKLTIRYKGIILLNYVDFFLLLDWNKVLSMHKRGPIWSRDTAAIECWWDHRCVRLCISLHGCNHVITDQSGTAEEMLPSMIKNQTLRQIQVVLTLNVYLKLFPLRTPSLCESLVWKEEDTGHYSATSAHLLTRLLVSSQHLCPPLVWHSVLPCDNTLAWWGYLRNNPQIQFQ